MSRVVHEFPDPDLRVLFDDYQRQAPAHFYRPDDDAILFDHFPDVTVALSPTLNSQSEANRSLQSAMKSNPRSADVFVLNHGITIWFGDMGVEINYTAMGFSGLTELGVLVIQAELVSSPNGALEPVMWNLSGNDVERLYHAIVRCCQLVATETTDDDQELLGSGPGWAVEGDWLFSSGVADDLDATTTMNDGDDAAMSVDVGYALTVGTKRLMREELSTKRSKTQ